MASRLSFLIEPISGGARSVTPCIDDVPMTDIARAYEISSGYTDPAGGYGGLVLTNFRCEPLDQYFAGRGEGVGESDAAGEIYVLGCDCGEAGCWPLTTIVRQTDDLVFWSGFRQPHRPSRDYEGLGPLSFLREQYESAVAELVEALKPAP